MSAALAEFDALVTRYYRPVSAFVYRRVGQPDRVEDLVQETFLEAYRSLKEGKQPEAFDRWLFGIAAHVCGKFLRRKKPRLFSPDAPPVDLVAGNPASLAEELEEQAKLMERVAGQLAELPAETRRLLELKHREGMTCEEIAAEVGRPAGTVKSILARTYKALRERLAPGGGT